MSLSEASEDAEIRLDGICTMFCGFGEERVSLVDADILRTGRSTSSLGPLSSWVVAIPKFVFRGHYVKVGD